MATGTLFDPVQRYDGQGRYSEPHFAFLNRAAGSEWERVRDLHESWYLDYPDPDGDLRARFRESDIHQHAPAWWELYMYTAFRRLGYAITVHPEVSGSTRRPDMLLTRGETRMYIECVVLFDDGSTRSSDGQAWLCDCIDAARNAEFIVGVRIHAHGSERPRNRDITQAVEGWLCSLDYDEVRQALLEQADPPSKSFDFRGWRVVLTALPVAPDRRGEDHGRIGYGPPSGTFVVTAVDGIRKVLDKKASQCQGVDAPLIVAMLSRGAFARLKELEQACFGSEGIRYRRNQPESAELIRQTDGYWHPGPPPRGGRVSAVLFSENLHASRVAAELPALWLNPWAHKPIAERLPFETHTARDTGEAFLAADATTSAEAVFGLSPDWPGF